MGSVVSKSVSSDPFGSAGSFLEYERIIFTLNRGDLIEIHRTKYRHWVICESVDSSGTVWCFHVTNHGRYQPIEEPDCQSVVRKEVPFFGKAQLRYEPLEDIINNTDDGKPSLCRVNNQQNTARKLVAALQNQLPDLNHVFGVLHGFKDSFFDYKLWGANCEHFCTFVKYGIGWSSQVNTIKDIVCAGLQLVSTTTKAMASFADRSGWHQIGFVCFLISTFASLSAEVVKRIEFTLSDMRIDEFVSQAIAY